MALPAVSIFKPPGPQDGLRDAPWWSGVDLNRLTPHPGPLPFEGRGSARGRFDDNEYRRARRCSISIGTRSKEHVYRRAQRTADYSEAANATPSPLKGERAGVRGEAVQINARPTRWYLRDAPRLPSPGGNLLG